METKTCSKCKENKKVCEFGKDSSRPNGLSYLCKKCLSEKTSDYRERNREKVLHSYKDYHNENKEIIKEKRKIRDRENYVKISEYRKKYFNENKLYFYELERNRRKNDFLFKITGNMRKRINSFLKINHIIKKNKTFDIVGCTPEFLKEYLEQKFTEGMSWELVGQHIHIDHIIPLSSAKSEEEIYTLCHYTNLQPLWAEDNLRKGNKIV
jgi:hypothetical protein